MCHQVVIHQRVLVPEQQVMHLPELSLEVGGLGSQSSMQGVRVNFGQWEVAKRVYEVVAQLGREPAPR